MSRLTVAPVVPVEAPTSFADMACAVLASLDAQIVLDDIKARLRAVFVAVGMQVGEWSGLPDELGENKASRGRSLRVTDPLDGEDYELTLRVTVQNMAWGCLLHIRAEVCHIATGRPLVVRSLFTCSWPEESLAGRAAILKPPGTWDGAHVEALANATSEAIAP